MDGSHICPALSENQKIGEMSSRRNKSIFWVIVGLVVVVFLYLASAGHLTFGENFEEEKEPEPPADEEPEQVTPVTRIRGAESLTPEPSSLSGASPK